MGYEYSYCECLQPIINPYTRRNPVKHPVLATIVAAGTLAAIVAGYQRGARVYQEMVDKGEINPLVGLNTVPKWETYDNRPITNLVLPAATPMSGYTNLYRIPEDEPDSTINTPFGPVRLRAAQGYYAGTGIFVYFPLGIRFGKKQTHDILELIAKRLFEDTDGKFHFEPSPGSSSGGSDIATGIITAGLDYDAYLRYHGRKENEASADDQKKRVEHEGYFKCSDAPPLREIAWRLLRIFDNLDGNDVLELTSITEDYVRHVTSAIQLDK